MNILSKLAIVGAAAVTLGLSSTAAFASVTPQNSDHGGNTQNWQPPKLTSDPCTTSWDTRGGKTLDSFPGNSDGRGTSCSPRPCKGYSDTGYTTWQQDGRYVSDESYNSNCRLPSPPRYVCKPQKLTFQLPTYGTWMKDVGGPSLHNGETVKYDGGTWTVGDWTTPPSPKANGSQGPGNYFILKDGGVTLQGLGTSKNHGPMLYEHATTICPPVLPVLHPAF